MRDQNRLNNPPYNNPRFDEILREMATYEWNIDLQDSQHALRRVAIVGAIIRQHDPEKIEANDLYEQDHMTIRGILQEFQKAGIHTHPEVAFDFYSINKPISSDFLLNTKADIAGKNPAADLVIISGVPRYGYSPVSSIGQQQRAPYKSTDEVYKSLEDTRHLSVSFIHEKKGAWPKSCENIGAKFIAVRGGQTDEISTHEMESENWIELVDTHGPSPLTLNGIFMVGNRLGIMAHKNCLSAYTESIDKNSRIGGAIIHTNTPI